MKRLLLIAALHCYIHAHVMVSAKPFGVWNIARSYIKSPKYTKPVTCFHTVKAAV
jgi:hypothetical protein